MWHFHLRLRAVSFICLSALGASSCKTSTSDVNEAEGMAPRGAVRSLAATPLDVDATAAQDFPDLFPGWTSEPMPASLGRYPIFVSDPHDAAQLAAQNSLFEIGASSIKVTPTGFEKNCDNVRIPSLSTGIQPLSGSTAETITNSAYLTMVQRNPGDRGIVFNAYNGIAASIAGSFLARNYIRKNPYFEYTLQNEFSSVTELFNLGATSNKERDEDFVRLYAAYAFKPIPYGTMRDHFPTHIWYMRAYTESVVSALECAVKSGRRVNLALHSGAGSAGLAALRFLMRYADVFHIRNIIEQTKLRIDGYESVMGDSHVAHLKEIAARRFGVGFQLEIENVSGASGTWFYISQLGTAVGTSAYVSSVGKKTDTTGAGGWIVHVLAPRNLYASDDRRALTPFNGILTAQGGDGIFIRNAEAMVCDGAMPLKKRWYRTWVMPRPWLKNESDIFNENELAGVTDPMVLISSKDDGRIWCDNGKRQFRLPVEVTFSAGSKDDMIALCKQYDGVPDILSKLENDCAAGSFQTDPTYLAANKAANKAVGRKFQFAKASAAEVFITKKSPRGK